MRQISLKLAIAQGVSDALYKKAYTNAVERLGRESGKVENFRSRMQVMPGLTGYAQVNGGYDLNPAEKLKYDLIYINHCSVLFDLWCLLKTIPVVFTMKGAR